MDTKVETADREVISLKACINDLIGVVALPALWRSGEPSHIVRTLLDMVVRMLRLDFVYVRLTHRVEGVLIEMVQTAPPGNSSHQPGEIRELLSQCLGHPPHKWPSLVHTTMKGQAVSIVPMGLGVHGEIGVMVAGSHRAEFPSPTDRLLLSVAANQAAIGLQEARLLSEQKRLASELDQRVAQRTRELAQANEELTKENAERRRVEGQLRALQEQLESHNAYLKEEVDSALSFGRIVGRSRALRRVLQQVEDVASTAATVLITGESGTGKELIAREIHERGPRSQQPFVRVNCSAIPREMFESEFFGHVRGAFTGAMRDRPGRFQIASGGTIFLDEIGELPADVQPKLLRVLQEGEYERVGEDATRKVDVRVIAATNRNLAEEVRAHRFREDLFYRLNVFPLELPPLRARRDDIPLLASHAIAEVSKRLGVQALVLTKADAARLQQYEWPGNIRELNNVIERAVILSKGARLNFDVALADMPGIASAAQRESAGSSSDDQAPSNLLSTSPPATGTPTVSHNPFRDHEATLILQTLRATGGMIGGPQGAAARLGLKRSTLVSKMKRLGIFRPRQRLMGDFGEESELASRGTGPHRP